MSRSDLEALLKPESLVWMSGTSREALPDVRDWLGGPLSCPGVLGRPYWMSMCGREELSETGRLF